MPASHPNVVNFRGFESYSWGLPQRCPHFCDCQHSQKLGGGFATRSPGRGNVTFEWVGFCADSRLCGAPAPSAVHLGVVGGLVHQISVILNGTMYTVVYDPPLKRDDKFSSLRRYVRIPARIDGDSLIIQWSDKTKTKGRIVGREKIEPDRPRPA